MTAYVPPGHDKPHFVYRCYDADDRLLYVGCTNSPKQRIYGHEGTAWWWPEFARVRNTLYPDRLSALARERRAIYEEKPRCNVKGRWYRNDPREDWTAQDYVEFHHAAVQTAHGIFGAHTSQLLKSVEGEASERHGILIPRTWATRRSA